MQAARAGQPGPIIQSFRGPAAAANPQGVYSVFRKASRDLFPVPYSFRSVDLSWKLGYFEVSSSRLQDSRGPKDVYRSFVCYSP